MADIRIKDLTTTASSTASDDFIAVDGTTNGTRKLSAFSPTFGGNATVTGTLTVNSTLTAANGTSTSPSICFASATTSGFARVNTNSIGIVNNGIASGYIDGITASGGLFIAASGTNQNISLNASGTGLITSANPVTFTNTTASTSTSSGALVVGNGTSGGLGVGGAINSGGAITAGVGTHSFGTSAGGGVNNFGSLLTYFNIRSTSDSDDPIFRVYDGRVNVSAFQVNARTGATLFAGEFIQGSNVNFNISSAATNGNVYIKSNGGTLFFNNTAGNGDIRLGNTGTVSYVMGTSASTSTSSGALVVSGGVGVAGNVNCGGVLSTGAGINAGVGVYIQNAALTGADQFGLASEPTWTSSAQFGHAGWFRTKTAAASYTLTAGRAIYVEQPTLGAGSSITTAVGVQVRNQGATGVTNAYGLYVESQSGASSLNYAIYTAGGRINFQGLPTSSAGLPAGTLWNDAGTLKVA